MRTTQLLNRVVNRTDGRKGGFQLLSSGFDHEHGGGHHGLICGQWDSFFDGRNPVCDRLCTHGVMRRQELFQGRWPHLLERLDRGPTAQQIADE